MDLLSDLWSRGATRPDCPNRLVGYHEPAREPIPGRIEDRLELAADYLERGSLLALFEGFPDAEDRIDP